MADLTQQLVKMTDEAALGAELEVYQARPVGRGTGNSSNSSSAAIILGINMDSHKELLGMRLAENEGAKFWLLVITELKNRGRKDILIA